MAKELADPYRPLQRRFWLIERIGWALLTVILLWALAGGAGGGVLAKQHVREGGVELSYERFARKGALTPIEIRWQGRTERTLSVSFDAGFVDRMRIDFNRHGLQPVRSANTVTVTVDRPDDSGALLLDAHPVELGTATSDIRIGEQRLGRVSTFVFP